MVEVDLRWPGVPTEPYLVQFPRVPVVGEQVIGPDDTPPLVVVAVTYHFADGFYFPPTRIEVRAEQNQDLGAGTPGADYPHTKAAGGARPESAPVSSGSAPKEGPDA